MENPQTPRDEQQKHILLALENGASRSKACAHAHVPRRTFYNWLEADAAFKAQVEEAEREAVDTMENLAYMCAEKALHDPRYLRAMFFYLKCKAGWKETSQSPTTPAVGAQHAAPTPHELPHVGARHAVPSPQNHAAPSLQNHPAPSPEQHPAPEHAAPPIQKPVLSLPKDPKTCPELVEGSKIQNSGDGAVLPPTCKAQHTELPVEVVPSVPSRPDPVGASRRLALVPGHILMKPPMPAQKAGPESRRRTRTGIRGKSDASVPTVPTHGGTYAVAGERRGVAWKKS